LSPPIEMNHELDISRFSPDKKLISIWKYQSTIPYFSYITLFLWTFPK
jgi:hypothetical protein